MFFGPPGVSLGERVCAGISALLWKSSPRKCFRIILRADAFLFILPMGGLRNCRPCNGQLNSKPRESRLAFRIHWISAARSSYTRHLDDTACQANRGCGPDPVPILPLPKYPQIPWCIMHQGWNGNALTIKGFRVIPSCFFKLKRFRFMRRPPQYSCKKQHNWTFSSSRHWRFSPGTVKTHALTRSRSWNTPDAKKSRQKPQAVMQWRRSGLLGDAQFENAKRELGL